MITKIISSDHIKEDEMGGACSTRGGDAKGLQNLGWKT
jgi:hypothetical protein